MASDSIDIRGLLRALAQDPEARLEFARLMFDEQISALRAEVQSGFQRIDRLLEQLVQAQMRTDQRFDELAAAQQRTDQRFDELAAAQQRTDQRFDELAAAQLRTDQRFDELAAALASLSRTTEIHAVHLDRLRGRDAERTYRERATAYFSKIARRIRVQSPEDLDEVLEAAVEAGTLTPETANDIRLADVVAKGRLVSDLTEVWLVVEVSATIDHDDVERAVRRAEALARTGITTVPVVAGEAISDQTAASARRSGVWVVENGRTQPPSSVATA
jgi:hypothetical protein